MTRRAKLLDEYPGIKQSREFSENQLETIRKKIVDNCHPPSNSILVTVGSLARKEASEQSDIDYFLISKTPNDQAISDFIDEFGKVLRDLGIRAPSKGGSFGGHVDYDSLLRNIGGDKDNTKHLTLRILFLLESEWLWGENEYLELFGAIINKYVRSTITQHAICRFLLNDFIRYYRTVCVDFEFKTIECDKHWGDRNIKLAFSRKLMYFSGLLAIAETAQKTPDQKRESLKHWLNLDPLSRVEGICGTKAEKCFEHYDHFLEKLSDDRFRKLLESTSEDRDTQSEDFRRIKNLGHHFSWQLAKLLDTTYSQSHPIHISLSL